MAGFDLVYMFFLKIILALFAFVGLVFFFFRWLGDYIYTRESRKSEITGGGTSTNGCGGGGYSSSRSSSSSNDSYDNYEKEVWAYTERRWYYDD